MHPQAILKFTTCYIPQGRADWPSSSEHATPAQTASTMPGSDQGHLGLLLLLPSRVRRAWAFVLAGLSGAQVALDPAARGHAPQIDRSWPDDILPQVYACVVVAGDQNQKGKNLDIGGIKWTDPFLFIEIGSLV
jgi:hypothetical protein